MTKFVCIFSCLIINLTYKQVTLNNLLANDSCFCNLRRHCINLYENSTYFNTYILSIAYTDIVINRIKKDAIGHQLIKNMLKVNITKFTEQRLQGVNILVVASGINIVNA